MNMDDRIRYMPPDNCVDVYRFVGSDQALHDSKFCGPDAEFVVDSETTAQPGDVIIRVGPGRYRIESTQ